MKQFFTTILLLSTTLMMAQTIVDFESFDLEDESFLNGSDGNGGFEAGTIFLPNSYNAAWNSWSGFAISNTTDTGTPGPTNQFSSIAGGGAENSEHYAVSFAGSPVVIYLNDDAIGQPVHGLYITNSTYTYWSMKEGDDFAKKFGGPTGNDPDFYSASFKAYRNGFLMNNDSVEFFLADYRAQDPADDYILFEWEWVDLTPLGDVDSLQITIYSSDTGNFGVNTPAYFCLDNVTTAGDPLSTTDLNNEIDFSIYPNPTSDFIIFDWEEQHGLAQIIDFQGKMWKRQLVQDGQNRIDLTTLPKGYYTIKIETAEGFLSEKFVKQ